MLKRLLPALFLFTAMTGVASATPTTFDLQNVTFGDGTTLTGSFVYDPATGTFGSFDIATAADSSLFMPAFTFDQSDSFIFFSNSATLILSSNSSFSDPDATQDESLFLHLIFNSALNASGNPITINTSNNSYECLNCFPDRFITAGSVVAEQPNTSATPEPSSLALLGTGVLGFAGVLRKRFA